jgi:cytidyltransferase-like protein
MVGKGIMDNLPTLNEDAVIFSGRFDPPHLGHIATINKLAEEFSTVVVVVLDYGSRRFPISYCMEVLWETVREQNKILVKANKTHFGEVTEAELLSFGCSHYASGNLSVLRHIELVTNKVKVTYTNRTFDYEASKYIFKE